MCWPTVDSPKPSAQENAIYEEILNLINQQQAYNQMMMPQIAHEQHYKIVEGEGTSYEYTESESALISDYERLTKLKGKLTTDISSADRKLLDKYGEFSILGQKVEKSDAYKSLTSRHNTLQDKASTYESVTSQEWVKMTDEEWYNDPNTTDAERAEWDAYIKSLERYNKAVAGELPLSQTLQQQKQQEFEQLKTAFPSIQGDTWDTATGTDTIGVQNLSEFKKRWATVEEAERYGTLTSGAQTAIQTTGLTTGMATQDVSNIAGVGGLYGGNQGAWQSLLAPYQQYNMAGYQAAAQNQAIANQGWGSLIGIGGTLGAAAIMASSKDYKKNIKEKTEKDEDKALESIKNTKSYSYKYKKKMGMGNREYIGAIAEESPDEVTTEEKNAIIIPDKLELVAMGIKSLARKIEKLEVA